ncbi:hypothetical protein TVAG_083760 [Trichomonas vaginalis G3]|uniref:Uncharacterized protein n=1 Tax=Trichomonas vaginalis (strain ATCC PRA-98 / G3) TaxID=412133 RepID=A2DMA0_TRIV3|nr:RNA polymerase II transcription factor SIII (Elongin) subunit A family [Trichomonas vaginalis G3]EAY18520.1 hypothetical protein TVAG_083760 [Trichomonas vaginalis G3]KAI5489490.1 RNA polymerase II transcription factor SIII (Elongin) subunit A family [Trichomonas vaginalis G3]|eukprot:XP_001579506.1 hypothetical protein [Trichomonas vaginalis G3]
MQFLPPHLSNEIIINIQTVDVLKRVYLSNKDYIQIDKMFNSAWKKFVNNKFLHGKASDDMLSDGQNWYDYYCMLEKKKEEELEQTRARPVEKVKKESKIVDGTARAHGHYVSSKSTTITEKNPHLRELYRKMQKYNIK